MKNIRTIYITSGLFGLALFLFWGMGYPQAMNYQEQNQLFLFTTDYFCDSLRIAGGLSDYISEYIVQFYYLPWVGAALLALIFMALQGFTWLLIKQHGGSHFALSFLPPLLMLWHTGDINTLLSLPVATLLAMLTAWRAKGIHQGTDLLTVPLLYWLIGPVVWLYVLLRCIENGKKSSWAITYLFVLQWLAYFTLLEQWPKEMVMAGLNYYRLPMQIPALQIMAPLSVAAVVAVSRWVKPTRLLQHTVQALVLGTAVTAVTTGFDKDMYEILKQDELVRKERWAEIIERAEKKQVQTAFSSQSVNLALAMTGQLPDRMFQFYQSGTDALIMPAMNDNTSPLPTAEAFYHLGMVNEALRYMFDIQQSILNFKKSGRCTKRIAECYLVNGNYKAAAKHLVLLGQSLFYRSWAKEAATYLYRDDKMNTHPQWGKLRQLRYKEQFLYNYNEKDKMLGLLFQENQQNRMALFYFMGQMLLDGNIQGFTGYMPWVQQHGGYQHMPAGYADAMKCIQAQGNLPGSDYAKYVQRMMKSHEK